MGKDHLKPQAQALGKVEEVKSLPRMSLRSKVFGLFLCGLFSFLLSLECLKRAQDKDFGGDEVTDYVSTLTVPSLRLIRGGVTNQQTGSPLYFVLQREVSLRLLESEQSRGQGWDWRLAFRMVPAFSLGFLVWIATILLWGYAPPMALVLPCFLATYGQMIWFGAESRLFSSWAGMSVLFYACTLGYALESTRIWGFLWALSALFLVSLSVTAPVQVGAASLCLILGWRFGGAKRAKDSLFVVAISILSLGLMKYWNVRKTGWSWSHATESLAFYWNHFQSYALLPLGGWKGLFLQVGLSLLFLVTPPPGRLKKFSRWVGGLVLLQLPCAAVVYGAQILSGYFFADRHVIFLNAVRAMGSSFGVAWLLVWVKTLLDRVEFRTPEGIKSALKSPAFAALFLGVFLFDWSRWVLIPAPTFAKKLWDARRTPYCHGPVPWTREPPVDRPQDRESYEFNEVNRGRHSGQCGYPAPVMTTMDPLALLKAKGSSL